jgi:hypothetical protein
MIRNQTLIQRRAWLALLFCLFFGPLLAACNTPAAPFSTATPAATAAATPENALSAPTQTPVPYPDPALATAAAATTAPEQAGYPLPASPAPTVDAYPGGLIWIIRPVGIQCEPGRPAGYNTLNEAVATLRAAGISAQGAETIERPVATACGSPTSEHYRVQIGADHLAAAEAMGWLAE